MSDATLNHGRRSTRLSISIPVVISGVDAHGNDFRESVRTLIVNKHGGKIATVRRLTLDSEVMVENLAMSVVAKASVVWLSDQPVAGEAHHVGLQLIEAQNVWGIAFPPDDWSIESQDEVPAAPNAPRTSEPSSVETPISSLAGEEITIRLLQELQQSADGHAREFKERVKQLTQRVGLELEFDLRERAAYAKAHEVGSLEEKLKTLNEDLSAARREMGEIQVRIQELKGSLPVAAANPPESLMPLQEARRQLSAMAKSVVESMNDAAMAGLKDYRSLLQKENQDSAERLRRAAPGCPPPRSPSPKS